MMLNKVAVWVLGPLGSGKSFAIAGLTGWCVVNQDQELERLMVEQGIPLDTREHTAAMKTRFASLRAAASDRTWNKVPDLRRTGRPIVFESTGDKPALLAAEVALDRQAGYMSMAVGMCCTLEDCLRGNQSRHRVLPDALVSSSWQTFQQHLSAGVYPSIFGDRHFHPLGRNSETDFASWVTSLIDGLNKRGDIPDVDRCAT